MHSLHAPQFLIMHEPVTGGAEGNQIGGVIVIPIEICVVRINCTLACATELAFVIVVGADE